MSIKHENLHSFKERMTLLCQGIILEMTQISYLHGSTFFTIPLSLGNVCKILAKNVKLMEVRARVYSSTLLHDYHMQSNLFFLKYFQILYIFVQILKYFTLFKYFFALLILHNLIKY